MASRTDDILSPNMRRPNSVYPGFSPNVVESEYNIPSSNSSSSWASSSRILSDHRSPGSTRFTGLFRGWRLIIFGSWLNTLLVLIPISWVLSMTMPTSHGLVFALCILALIPLVKLHDLSTRELALRIGGSKAGLINASMSNTVGIVLAISALRKCELRVVQSSLMGSMLSKLLLVLGLCFFAGGMRFSEQGFDATATQVHSSLLSISVGALLLPAAYHFALSGIGTDIPEWQIQNILRMSRGVSVLLLFIYMAYLIFQLWSHSHLYNDNNKTNASLPLKKLKMLNGSYSTGKLQQCSCPSNFGYSPSQLPKPCRQVHSKASLFSLDERKNSIVPPACNASEYSLSRCDSDISGWSSNTTIRIRDDNESSNGQGSYDSAASVPCSRASEPRVSWFLTILSLVTVTVAASVTADWLVESMDGISKSISKEWVGLILLPAVTAVAECMTAVNVSVKDQLTLSVSVAVGSTIQTALFVIPFMVALGWSMGKPLSLLMDPFESFALYLSVQTVGYVVGDGKSNWLEGLILICLYTIIAVSFWFYPGLNLPTSMATCVAST